MSTMKEAMKRMGVKMRKQDAKFPDAVMYAAVFFPKVQGMKTGCPPFALQETSAGTAAKAKALFLARTIGGWRKYSTAGWQIRKIKVIDLGPA